MQIGTVREIAARRGIVGDLQQARFAAGPIILADLLLLNVGRIAHHGIHLGKRACFQQLALLRQRHGIVVVTPPRKRMQVRCALGIVRASGRWRKRLETVGSHFTQRVAVARIRV